MERSTSVPNVDVKQIWETTKLEQRYLAFLNSPEIASIFNSNGRLKTNQLSTNFDQGICSDICNSRSSSCMMPVIEEELDNMSCTNSETNSSFNSYYSHHTQLSVNEQVEVYSNKNDWSMEDLGRSFEHLSTKPTPPLVNWETRTRNNAIPTTEKKSASRNTSSPYDRCRSSATCGRNCIICHGSNVNSKKTSTSTEYNLHPHRPETVDSADSGNFSSDYLYFDKNTESRTCSTSPESVYIFDESSKNETIMTPTDLDCIVMNSESHDLLLRDFDYVVAEDFESDDVRVLKGDSVMLLNNEKDDWVSVLTERGKEGFIPRLILREQNCHCEECQNPPQPDEHRPYTSLTTTNSSAGSSSGISDDSENRFRLSGSKFIVNADFNGTVDEELTVSVGDEVFVNMDDQLLEGWFWVYSARLKRDGFIPRSILYSLRISNV